MRAIVLFFVVFGLNVIPAFAPPTWMVFSYIGFRFVTANNIALLAVIGAAAATLGRLVLSKMARVIVRQRFLSQSTRDNIDSIREYLEPRHKLTFGVFLFYAFSPFPSNYLFIAYGLTTMEFRKIAAPFFIGRSISYSFWGLTASSVAARMDFESTSTLSYFSLFFVVTQILLLSLIYVFARVDWRALLGENKFRWLARVPAHPPESSGKISG
ncbi:MAG: hypothetical protein LAO19_03150 [Acidobacteriia bacterium]|nr:hypothetical protein [Terriglobia bacterium]